MKNFKTVLFILLITSFSAYSQNKGSNFRYWTSGMTWTKDGKSILFSVVRFDADRIIPPANRKYWINVRSGELTPIAIEGSGLSLSPDGNEIAYVRPMENKHIGIFRYDIKAKSETLLYSDTTNKSSITWSPDAKKIAFNFVSRGRGPHSILDIAVFDLKTRKVTTITEGNHKSYNPEWNPANNTITYYLEKGDNHDQIYLTDSKGSFHQNLTRDTTSHFYYPSWMDENTIVCTQAPESIITINKDGTNKKIVEGLTSTNAKFNRKTNRFVFTNKEGELLLYDRKSKNITMLISADKLKKIEFN